MPHWLRRGFLDGTLKPVILIGAHAARELPGISDPRAAEYLPGFNEEGFARHEEFFHAELIAWAEMTYGASRNRADRAIFGLSNGAAFASYMGIHHPDTFGAVIAFSQGWEVEYIPPENALTVRFYLQVGTLEPIFHTTTIQWRDILRQAGVEIEYRERVSGHDPVQWREGLPDPLIWVFGATDELHLLPSCFRAKVI
jgi:enterochelin esterase-like enzyme